MKMGENGIPKVTQKAISDQNMEYLLGRNAFPEDIGTEEVSGKPNIPTEKSIPEQQLTLMARLRNLYKQFISRT